MPRVCEFFGITIHFYFDDHAPPHFHAKYQGEDAQFDLRTLALLKGSPKPRVRALVTEWGAQRQADLRRAWEQCRRGEVPDPIAPLE